MSWISSFFKSSVAKQLLDLSGKILVARLGEEGKNLWAVAKSTAYEAESSGKSGAEKKQIVMNALNKQFIGIKQGFAETAVQLAWMWVDTFVMEMKSKS